MVPDNGFSEPQQVAHC